MRWPVVLGAIALASCDYRGGPLPDRAEIIRVEEALSRAQCIGRITSWSRTYQYRLQPSSIVPGIAFLSSMDRKIIDFDLSRHAKPGGFTVHRRPPYPPISYILDDLAMARGSYDLRSGKLTFRFCQATEQ